MRFGQLLQDQRVAREKSLRDLGAAVGLSAIYLSDLERGNRRPPATPTILRIAHVLAVDPRSLLRAAMIERTTFEFEVPQQEADSAKGQFMVALARVWDECSDDAFESLTKHLEKGTGKD